MQRACLPYARERILLRHFGPLYLMQMSPPPDNGWPRKTFTVPPGAVGLRYQFVILLADDPAGRIIGTVGINELVPVPTLGYLIHPDEWGKGYATEATSSMIKAWWSLPRRGKWGKRDKLYAICNEKNLGSFKVLLKCGFHVAGEQTMEDGAVLKNFELERPDWSL
ncbi:N-acetyltransferase [Histoplasma ohiense]|nr:N-acetyltransferase [Histoplasma ohiense (nom. inval.)]